MDAPETSRRSELSAAQTEEFGGVPGVSGLRGVCIVLIALLLLVAARAHSNARNVVMRDPLPTMRIDLDAADPAFLELLPGIGPRLAEEIVQTRGLVGAFGEPEEILRVPGIGPVTLERVRPLVRAGEAP